MHVCHMHVCDCHAPKEAAAGNKQEACWDHRFLFPICDGWGPVLHTGKGYQQTLLCLVVRPPLIHICVCCETSQAAERLPRSGASDDVEK